MLIFSRLFWQRFRLFPPCQPPPPQRLGCTLLHAPCSQPTLVDIPTTRKEYIDRYIIHETMETKYYIKTIVLSLSLSFSLSLSLYIYYHCFDPLWQIYKYIFKYIYRYKYIHIYIYINICRYRDIISIFIYIYIYIYKNIQV